MKFNAPSCDGEIRRSVEREHMTSLLDPNYVEKVHLVRDGDSKHKDKFIGPSFFTINKKKSKMTQIKQDMRNNPLN